MHHILNLFSEYLVINNKRNKFSQTENPLTLGGVVLNEKVQYKYLGDMIHKDGLSASINATINDLQLLKLSP